MLIRMVVSKIHYTLKRRLFIVQQIKFFNRLKSAWLLVKKNSLSNLLKNFVMALKEKCLFVVVFIGGGFKVFRIIKITQQHISNNSIIAISL